MIYYLFPGEVGLDSVSSLGDGTTINVKWNRAFSRDGYGTDGYYHHYKIANHIYYSEDQDKVFDEGVKFISYDGYDNVNIIGLTPGQLYFFSVRPIEYDPLIINLDNLPTAFNNLKVYPETLLRENINKTDLIIPLLDVATFPDSGIIKIGVELIKYLAVDRVNNNLVLNDVSQRGYLDTYPRLHTTDGYDGLTIWDPKVIFFAGKEATIFDRIYPNQSRFDINNYSATVADGYKQTTKDILTSDLDGSDAFNVNFPSYDYSGWHRIDPVLILKGGCIGSYIGGEIGCANGEPGPIRGLSMQDKILQRQEYLLSLTGEPVVLIRRQRTGVVCKCVLPTSDYPDDRCPYCYGTKFVMGWEQYYNPRRSDGRIMVRFGTADEDLKMQEAGLESDLNPEIWTLTVPTIKDRDLIIRFDQDGNEEFRYEVLSVSRNRTVLGLEGAQKCKLQRIRKFDTAYQIKVFRDTGTAPGKYYTTITNPYLIGPHAHEIVISDVDLEKSSQLTSIAAGHNHTVYWDPAQGKLIVADALDHSHEIMI